MSRSYKKKSILKDNGGMKKHSHAKFRRKSKQKIQEQDFDSLPNYQREVVNQYDVCDWKFIYEQEDDYYEKAKRK